MKSEIRTSYTKSYAYHSLPVSFQLHSCMGAGLVSNGKMYFVHSM